MTTTQTHTKKRFFKITVLFILLCLCTHIFMPRNVDFTRINPADYRWALLSKKYRSGSIAPENEQGYLFFVTADGRSTSVKMKMLITVMSCGLLRAFSIVITMFNVG